MSNVIQISLVAILLLGIIVAVIGCVSETSPAPPQMSSTSESATTESSAPTKGSTQTQANQAENNQPEKSASPASPAPPVSETGGIIKTIRDIVSPVVGDTLGDFFPVILDDQVNSQRNLIIIAVGLVLAILCAVLVSGILV